MGPLTRRGALATAAVALSGCSTDDGNGGAGEGDGETDAPANPALAAARGDGTLRVSSPAFDEGGEIPRTYGRGEANVNPPLTVGGVPDGAGSLAIVVDDPDAVEVVGEIFVHWLVWNVPPDTSTIPEDWAPETAIEGENDFGDVGYGGPAPPDDPHTYRFKCFAVDGTLDLAAGATVDALGAALDGRILARAQLTGTYAP